MATPALRASAADRKFLSGPSLGEAISFQDGVLPGSQRKASLGANLLLCGVAA